MPISLIAHVVVIPEKLEAVKSILTEVVEPSRKEPGCIYYQLMQNQEKPTEFTIVEEWESSEAMDAHFASAHYKKVHDSMQEGMKAEEADIRTYTSLG